MECLYQSYEDNGIAFKKAMQDFEQVLISEEILKDRSGKGYRGLFEKIVSTNEFPNWPKINFNSFVTEIGKPRQEILQNCVASLEKPPVNKFETLANTIQSYEDVTPATLANGVLESLDEKDFIYCHLIIGVQCIISIRSKYQ